MYRHPNLTNAGWDQMHVYAARTTGHSRWGIPRSAHYVCATMMMGVVAKACPGDPPGLFPSGRKFKRRCLDARNLASTLLHQTSHWYIFSYLMKMALANYDASGWITNADRTVLHILEMSGDSALHPRWKMVMCGLLVEKLHTDHSECSSVLVPCLPLVHNWRL